MGWTAPIHPGQTLTAAKQVRKVGEVAYMSAMSKLAYGWIAEDPERFMRLTAWRIWLSFFPNRDMVTWFPIIGAEGAVGILTVVGLLKVVSCIGSLILSKNIVRIGIFGILPLCPYWITHIYLRYSLLTYFTTLVVIVLAGHELRWHSLIRSAVMRSTTRSNHL